MQQFALALDLKDDPHLIAEYEEYHRNVWPDVLAAIKHVGILEMKIFRTGNRMFMLMETTDEYDEHSAAQYFKNDPKSCEWEILMDNFQQRIEGSPVDSKWVAMACCFQLTAQPTQ